MARHGQVTFESRLEQCQQKIKEKPQRALPEIGKLVVAEVRKVTLKKTGCLRKSLGYWFRKKEGDLQVGFKAWYAVPLILGTLGTKASNFFMDKIIELKDDIQELIQQALKELEKED